MTCQARQCGGDAQQVFDELGIEHLKMDWAGKGQNAEGPPSVVIRDRFHKNLIRTDQELHFVRRCVGGVRPQSSHLH
jgi:hypothetical protein